MNDDRQEIAPYVLDAVQHVRRRHLRNLDDREEVIPLAHVYGFDDAVDWLVVNRSEYPDALATVQADTRR